MRLTALVTRFSVRYLHRDPGFVRFFLLLCVFDAGMQLLVLAGSYDLTNESLSQQAFFNDTLKVKWLSPTKYYDLFKANPTWFTDTPVRASPSVATAHQPSTNPVRVAPIPNVKPPATTDLPSPTRPTRRGARVTPAAPMALKAAKK